MPESVHARLDELKREVRRELRPPTRSFARVTASRSRGRSWLAVALGVLKVAAVVALPFVVYVRSSVFLYAHATPPWLAVTLGALLTTGVVAGYAAWLSRRASGRARLSAMARWILVPVAAAWCGYAVLYLARVNAKSDAVRQYYSAVHPVLRVALATAILVDQDMVVTDMRRVPEDYARMRLPANDRTKHYRQPNGWVHAVDLRTRERGELRNRAVQLYFWMMGFDTLRHVGTADHLHVQLQVRN